jgi:hypothetical protein
MFYCYNQNNSGGSFVINDSVAHYVFIEADSANEANDRAEDVGIYFNSVNDDRDCECCGDRWSAAWCDDGKVEPMIYGTPVASFTDMFAQEGKPYAYVYYKDGRKESFQ